MTFRAGMVLWLRAGPWSVGRLGFDGLPGPFRAKVLSSGPCTMNSMTVYERPGIVVHVRIDGLDDALGFEDVHLAPLVCEGRDAAIQRPA